MWWSETSLRENTYTSSMFDCLRRHFKRHANAFTIIPFTIEINARRSIAAGNELTICIYEEPPEYRKPHIEWCLFKQQSVVLYGFFFGTLYIYVICEQGRDFRLFLCWRGPCAVHALMVKHGFVYVTEIERHTNLFACCFCCCHWTSVYMCVTDKAFYTNRIRNKTYLFCWMLIYLKQPPVEFLRFIWIISGCAEKHCMDYENLHFIAVSGHNETIADSQANSIETHIAINW